VVTAWLGEQDGSDGTWNRLHYRGARVTSSADPGREISAEVDSFEDLFQVAPVLADAHFDKQGHVELVDVLHVLADQSLHSVHF